MSARDETGPTQGEVRDAYQAGYRKGAGQLAPGESYSLDVAHPEIVAAYQRGVVDGQPASSPRWLLRLACLRYTARMSGAEMICRPLPWSTFTFLCLLLLGCVVCVVQGLRR